MNLPEVEKEVLVKLDNGNFAVAYYDEKWYAGKGVYGSHEDGNDILSGKVIGWSTLPETLENEKSHKSSRKP